MIGAGNAIVSAALGFWAAEALTLVGGVIWWVRPAGYRPAFCLVDGKQVDYDAAAKAALELETDEDRRRRAAAPAPAAAPLAARARLSAALGLGAGIVGGIAIGLAEAAVIAAGGFGDEAQVLWYGPLAYALVLGGLGLAGGLALAVLPMDRDEIRGWTPSLALVGTCVPMALAISLFRVRRDVYLEQMPPLPVLAAMLGAAAAVALLLFFAGPRLFRTRAGAFVRPLPALGLLALVVAGGALAARHAASGAAPVPAAKAVPAELAARPNVILVMVDTLRADHLSCYGSDLATPALCSVAEQGGSRFNAFSHASWTRPAAATLLTSLVPSSHGVMSKTSALSPEIVMLPELLQQAGYTTGGIAANINLAQSLGFAQGYDEYHYLAPDYLAGAQESSSKLVVYNIGRAVWFKLKRGLDFGDFYQDSQVVNEVAFDFLERNKGSRFFLFLHYMDPHDPYFAHPYDGTAIARVSNQHPSPELAAEMRRLYRGEIEYLDGNFAKLLAKVRELGIENETMIVLTADHGEEFHDHGGFWHGLTLYDEQVRVPLLVRWSGDGTRAPAEPLEHVVGLVDVAPTILARAGVPAPPAMQGVDLALGATERPERNRRVFSEEDHEGNVLRSVRTEEWKLIEANPDNPRGLAPEELFHVAEDPGERRDLAKQRPEEAAGLRRHADAQAQLARSQGKSGEAAELSASEQEALRQLGYAD
jgi:arylsulfatase A-like enzyme